MTVGPVAVWVTARRAAAPVCEVGERPRLVADGLRHPVHAQPHLGDDAEGALRADQQLAQVGAGGRFRCAAQIHRAHRGDHAQPANHVVEPAVARRVLAGRSGRREAADGGVLEALREMPEREAVFAEQAFGVRPGDPGPENGLAGHLVEGDQPVEAAQIKRHHGAELAADRIEPADHAGAAAERDHGDAVLGAVAQDRGDGVVVAGQQHGVGRVLDAGVLAPQQVEGGLAAGAQQPIAVGGAAVLGADDPGQRVLIRLGQRRRAQLHLVGIEFGLAGSSTPTACLSNDRIPSESGFAAAGSPHAFHFIGGRRSSACVMRYSITHAVNQ